MFEAKIKVDLLREVIRTVSILVEEAKIYMGPDGMRTRAVDPAHVAMIDIELEPSVFEEFKGDGAEVALDVDKLKDVFSLVKSDRTVTLVYDDKKNILEIRMENMKRRMSLLDPATLTDPNVPNLSPSAKVVVPVEQILQGLKASESVSDHIIFRATPEDFTLEAKGDTDNVELRLPKSQLGELDCKEEARSLFSVSYLIGIVKTISSAEEMTIYLGTNYPAKLEFSIAKGNGKARYLLAPRIENE